MPLTERLVQVSADPVVRLLVAQTKGPADQVLLVIHGGPDWDHTYLREPLTQLTGRHRVIFPDLRGCGRSTRGLATEQHTPDAVVSDLLTLLDTLGTKHADVLGFSYGGQIAQRLTLAAPQRVRRLVIASSTTAPVPSGAPMTGPKRPLCCTASRHQHGRTLRGRPQSRCAPTP
jgi:pimeloyl-ACP methyl ester carboxylesterase